MDMTTNCYLNGKFLPLEKAQISVLDRGFLFGDGVYEVIPVYAGRLFCWQRHVKRLTRNLSELGIVADVTLLSAPAQQLASAGGDCALYIQITRGVAPRRHPFPNPPPPPTVLMFILPRAPVSSEKLQNGVACCTMAELRWLRADIKSVSLLGSVLAAQQAAVSECDEVILIRDGFAGEAAASNLFMVADKTLITPPADNRILPGITREVVLQLAEENNMPAEVRDIQQAELATADELWLTSSTRETMPITMLDNKPVGSGKPGAVFAAMLAAFRKFVTDERE